MLNSAQAGAMGVGEVEDGNLPLPVPFMYRLNQTEPVTFQFCCFGRSWGIMFFSFLLVKMI
jgi:hypothetical protein